ncbi:MAG: IPTL-CTERM sorting domain-containing protein [Planctomycetota bacterium]
MILRSYLGLRSDGSIAAWGCGIPDYNYGQCIVPAPNTGFVAVAAGFYHSLGLKADGSIVAWGNNYSDQTTVPAPNTGFVAVAAGGYHSLAIRGSGACCLSNGSCMQVASQAECDSQSGVYRGLGSDCGGDLDGDSLPDICDPCPYDPTNTQVDGRCIPTVSEWGLILMAAMLLGVGGRIVMKRRALP